MAIYFNLLQNASVHNPDAQKKEYRPQAILLKMY